MPCQAPWILVESGLVEGRRLTSVPTIRTDLVRAGAQREDEEVVVDGSGGFRLFTSRTPDDLDARPARPDVRRNTMTDPYDPESAAWDQEAASAQAAPEPTTDEDTELLAETSEDEYARPDEEEPGEVSIDDALETDRVVAEGADSRNADGYGFDEDRERGTEDAVAAEQGNRDEDRMESDVDDEELDHLAGTDGEALGTERDLADPEA